MKERDVELDATSSAWMVRSLPDRISSIHILEESIIAGDWSGGLSRWSLEGETIWESSGPNRVSSIDVCEEYLVTSMGVDLLLFSLNDGTQLWRQELEGSADEAALLFGDGVHAISSVFDIEHGDFMESAYWHFSIEGELQTVHRFSERPWLFDVSENRILMGLGRPRCGMFCVKDNELEWTELIEDDPVSCGIGLKDRVVMGHSNGGLSKVSSAEVSTLANLDMSIDDLVSIHSGLVLLSESSLHHWSNEGELDSWQEESEIQGIISSFALNDEPSAAWAIIESSVCSFSNQGEKLVSLTFPSKPSSLSGNEKILAVGLENGDLYVFQRELLLRRLEKGKSDQITESDSHRVSLMEKLRKLR